MKKIIVMLLCLSLVCFAFASCTTYEVEVKTEEKTEIITEETAADSERESNTEDDGWDIETDDPIETTDDDNVEFAFVGGANYLDFRFVFAPLFGHGACGNLRIQFCHILIFFSCFLCSLDCWLLAITES